MPPTSADRSAIEQAARDYIEGFYEGALTLVQITGARAERPTPVVERQQDVTVLDVFENAASAKVIAGT